MSKHTKSVGMALPGAVEVPPNETPRRSRIILKRQNDLGPRPQNSNLIQQDSPSKRPKLQNVTVETDGVTDSQIMENNKFWQRNDKLIDRDRTPSITLKNYFNTKQNAGGSYNFNNTTLKSQGLATARNNPIGNVEIKKFQKNSQFKEYLAQQKWNNGQSYLSTVMQNDVGSKQRVQLSALANSLIDKPIDDSFSLAPLTSRDIIDKQLKFKFKIPLPSSQRKRKFHTNKNSVDFQKKRMSQLEDKPTTNDSLIDPESLMSDTWRQSAFITERNIKNRPITDRTARIIDPNRLKKSLNPYQIQAISNFNALTNSIQDKSQAVQRISHGGAALAQNKVEKPQDLSNFHSSLNTTSYFQNVPKTTHGKQSFQDNQSQFSSVIVQEPSMEQTQTPLGLTENANLTKDYDTFTDQVIALQHNVINSQRQTPVQTPQTVVSHNIPSVRELRNRIQISKYVSKNGQTLIADGKTLMDVARKQVTTPHSTPQSPTSLSVMSSKIPRQDDKSSQNANSLLQRLQYKQNMTDKMIRSIYRTQFENMSKKEQVISQHRHLRGLTEQFEAKKSSMEGNQQLSGVFGRRQSVHSNGQKSTFTAISTILGGIQQDNLNSIHSIDNSRNLPETKILNATSLNILEQKNELVKKFQKTVKPRGLTVQGSRFSIREERIDLPELRNPSRIKEPGLISILRDRSNSKEERDQTNDGAQDKLQTNTNYNQVSKQEQYAKNQDIKHWKSKLTESKQKLALKRYPNHDKYYITMPQSDLMKKLDEGLKQCRVNLHPFDDPEEANRKNKLPLNPLIKKCIRTENLTHYKRRPMKTLNPLSPKNKHVSNFADSEFSERQQLTFLPENFSDEVLKFIERRLKYRYRRKLTDPKSGIMKRFPYRLESNHLNCGVQLINSVRDRNEHEQKLIFGPEEKAPKLKVQATKLSTPSNEDDSRQGFHLTVKLNPLKPLKQQSRQGSPLRRQTINVESPMHQHNILSTGNSAMSNYSKSPSKKQNVGSALNSGSKEKKEMPPEKVNVPGMPPFPDCSHEGHKLDMYQELADQFKQIIIWLQHHKEMCHTHLDKLQIIDILDENFYDMQNLTMQEQMLFEDKDYAMELLLSPLLNLVKEDIKQLEDEQEKLKKFPIKNSKFNNDDQIKFIFNEQLTHAHLCEEDKQRYYESFQYMQDDKYILLGELGKPDPPSIKNALKKEFTKIFMKPQDQSTLNDVQSPIESQSNNDLASPKFSQLSKRLGKNLQLNLNPSNLTQQQLSEFSPSPTSTMSPGLRSRLLPEFKPKVNKVPCNFKYILDKEAKDYLDKLVNIFKEQSIGKNAPNILNYIQDTNQSSRDKLDTQNDEIFEPNSVSKFEKLMMRMENLYYMDRPKYGRTIAPQTKAGKEHYRVFNEPKKFEGFVKEFGDQVRKYYKEKVVQWKKKQPPIQQESDDETEAGVHRKDILTYKVPEFIRKQCKGRTGKDGYNIYQHQEDKIVNQAAAHQSMFKDMTEKAKFFSYGKNFNNECTTNLEEEHYFKAMKKYEQDHTLPLNVMTLIKDNSLILNGEMLTDSQVQVICNYMSQLLEDSNKNILHFHVKNSSISEPQLSQLLNVICLQPRLQTLRLYNQDIREQSQSHILNLLKRPRPCSLQELTFSDGTHMKGTLFADILEQLSKVSHLQKLKLKDYAFFFNNQAAQDNFYEFLRQQSLIPEKQVAKNIEMLKQPLTHLELSNVGLSLKDFNYMLEPLSDNKCLQSLDISGNILNKLSAKKAKVEEMKEDIDSFNEILNIFLETNRNNLINLNISGMISNVGTQINLDGTVVEAVCPINFQRLIKTIGSFSNSIQSVHLDNNFISQNDKVEFSKLLDADYFKDPTQDDEDTVPEPSKSVEPDIDDYSLVLIQPPFAPNFDCRIFTTEQFDQIQTERQDKDADNFEKMQEQLKEQLKINQLNSFLAKKGVSHLLDNQDVDIEQKIIDSQLQSIIRKSTAEETVKNDVLGERGICQDQNIFTICRRRGMRAGYHIPYADKIAFIEGVRKSDMDEELAGAFRPTLYPSTDMFRWHVQTKHVRGYEPSNICQQRDHIQQVSIFYKQGLDELTEIENKQTKTFLKDWFLPGNPQRHKHPLIFGSITHWRVFEMLPIELFAYQMIREFIVPKQGDGFTDFMNTFSYKQTVEIFLRRIYDGKSAESQQIMQKFTRALIKTMNIPQDDSDDHYWKILKDIMHDSEGACSDFLNYCLQMIYYEQVHDSLFFFQDCVLENYNYLEQGYVQQLEVHMPRGQKSAQHSIIIYEPVTDKFYTTSIYIHRKVNGEDRPPYQRFI